MTTPIGAAQLPYLTQVLLDAEFNEAEIHAVMGGNTARFLATHLPMQLWISEARRRTAPLAILAVI